MTSEWHRLDGDRVKKKERKGGWNAARMKVALELTPEVDAECNRMIDIVLADLATGTSADLAWRKLGLYYYSPMLLTIKKHPRYLTEVKSFIKLRRVMKGKIR